MRSPFTPLLVALAALIGLGVGCDDSPTRRPAPYLPVGAEGGGGAGGEVNDCNGPPAGACGNQITAIDFDAPNIYFVFDKSGSMADVIPPANVVSRYSAVRDAAVTMVKSLGALINVGAALFPRNNVCGAGSEVMAITPGDPTPSDGSDGPTTATFRTRTAAQPEGGTPVAATLEALLPNLQAAAGKTVVMLLTDGGPNCNSDITCDASECQPIIEGSCPANEDCCSPTHPTGGPELCIDRSATVAGVAAIAALGIEVYIIGITGSETYEDVLNAMAVAGGTAQTGGPTQYHRVTDVSAIGEVFAKIAADAISCELPLAERPSEEDTRLTNVYLDCELLPFDPINGWGWLEGNKIWLHGEACEKLKSGAVGAVHVAFGCPTETPK